MTFPISETIQLLLERFLLFLPKMMTAFVVLVVGLYLVAFLARVARKGLESRKVDRQATHVVVQLLRWVLTILVVVIALQQVSFNLTAFVASLGVLGFTIGFALKDISENFTAGLLLLLQRPFELGDLVEIEGFFGKVSDVSLRATEILTQDGHHVIIPNSTVFTNPIINYTRTPTWRIGVEVGVAYNSDLDQVRQATVAALTAHPMILKDPAPYLVFNSFGDSAINLTAFYWIDSREVYPKRASDFGVVAISKGYATAGIEIPFPIRTLLMEKN